MPRRFLRSVLAAALVLGAGAAVATPGASAQSALAGGKVAVRVFHARSGAAAVLVPIRIGRKRGYFILDTGAEKSMINARVARALGLRPTGRRHRICGVTGCAHPSREVKVGDWAVGGVQLPAARLAQGDFAALFPGPIVAAGLLGADMLSAYGKFNLDFAKSELTLGDGLPPPPSPGAPSPGAPASPPAAPGAGLVAG